MAPPQWVVDRVEADVPGFWRSWLTKVLSAAYDSGARIEVSSWYRDPERNSRIGGARYSQHQVGAALDLVTDNPVGLEASMEAQGLVAIRYAGHVHVQAYPAQTLAPVIRSVWGIEI